MKLKLLILCCVPIMVAAQEVKPILSADYLALIRSDSSQTKNKVIAAVTNDIGKSVLQYSGGYFYQNTLIKNIKIGQKNNIVLQPATPNILYIGGTASTMVQLQNANRLPSLQHQNAQGESANGKLAWKGPETGELFSFGPFINSLEFDGTNYPYDVNGKLVAKGIGSGIPAKDYDNSIFRTAVLFTNSATLQAKYMRDYQHSISASFTAAQSSGNTFIINNKNKTDKISASLDGTLNGFTISGTYFFQQQKFSNSNRGSFLNRVYQNALLTPISFDNNQGTMIGNAQRSYSAQTDNPLFLLDNDHSFLSLQHNTSLSLEQKFKNGKIKLIQSYEKISQQSNEGYKPSTAFFPNGILVNRTANDANYFLNANAQYVAFFHSYRFSATTITNYIFKNNQSSINYLNSTNYNYKRSSHDAAISLSPTFRGNYFESGLTLTNKIYASNTAAQSNFFLPAATGFIRFYNLFHKINVKLSIGYNRFNSELPINLSFAQTNLLQYSTSNNLQYLPTNEVNSFNNILPIEHKEYTAAFEANYQGKFIFLVDWFSRQTVNDIFPIINAGQLQLQNLADHRNQGIELQFSHFITKKEIQSF